MSPARKLAGALAGALLLAFADGPALAQDDRPIAYPDDERPTDGSSPGHRVTESEATSRPSLSRLDDPSTGVAAEVLLASLFLLEGSRGGSVDLRFGWGARFTWEAGRRLQNELLHEGLFLDVAWLYVSARDGTKEVYGESNYHYFTLAPALGFPLGSGAPVALYGQLGGGVTYEYGVFNALSQNAPTLASGIKPTFLYGVGLRGRPLLSEESGVRLVFRIEVTRFRRAYMDDTYFGGSLGLGL